ncbi:p-hydroxycinnamoyl CoA hydratase/lyase [Streptomyces justiciae]|uniref:p-hydroxycinnamoyl CoA hydratase/lyase n=1 Tax=Streptomyces justiciae TaxID=2780140 RepID=UPI0021179FE6|nr:p-hydroxycinnamoyl CoA hydratase/lyase [Streptomyces justiciae]MCW8378702.1 p-hydroxycinnamoyl CoA hydratase/lyase [Streptomyces justiciae]
MSQQPSYDYENVLVEISDGIAWVALNRPDKRNAMSPALNEDMRGALIELEGDDRAQVVVLTGVGEAFSAGMDLQAYFRDVDKAHPSVQIHVRRVNAEWQWRHLQDYSKPTIAMVNGWCFGGAFVPLVSCDLAIAAEDAVFGLSEVNWGIPPGSVVSRALAETVSSRDALYYIMTGETFDGTAAEKMRLVNSAVPRQQLRQAVTELADNLKDKNPVVLRAAKIGYRKSRLMSWELADDYLYAKLEQSQYLDSENGRESGLQQFLDEKSYRPGLGSYDRTQNAVDS